MSRARRPLGLDRHLGIAAPERIERGLDGPFPEAKSAVADQSRIHSARFVPVTLAKSYRFASSGEQM
jgi:hypothetical protein